jgi:hypothetical protein
MPTAMDRGIVVGGADKSPPQAKLFFDPYIVVRGF